MELRYTGLLFGQVAPQLTDQETGLQEEQGGIMSRLLKIFSGFKNKELTFAAHTTLYVVDTAYEDSCPGKIVRMNN